MVKRFILYSDDIDGIKEYEKIDGAYKKLDVPRKVKMSGVYRHSFPCSLSEALKSWKCWKQILKFERFYYSITKDKTQGTKFNIFMLPIVYLYCLIDTRKFNNIKFI